MNTIRSPHKQEHETNEYNQITTQTNTVNITDQTNECNCNRVYCIHVSGHHPLTFFSCPLSFFDWVGVLWPQLSKVLKLVRWARRILQPRRPSTLTLVLIRRWTHLIPPLTPHSPFVPATSCPDPNIDPQVDQAYFAPHPPVSPMVLTMIYPKQAYFIDCP